MIYVTEFNKVELITTSFSVDSFFNCIDDVIDALGHSYDKRTKRLVSYDNVIFSDFPFSLPGNENDTI